MKLTAIVRGDGDSFFSLCPELDVASQGDTIEEARANLKEAVELFLESAPEEVVELRRHPDIHLSFFEVEVGALALG